jgi:hypothetical protein
MEGVAEMGNSGGDFGEHQQSLKKIATPPPTFPVRSAKAKLIETKEKAIYGQKLSSI